MPAKGRLSGYWVNCEYCGKLVYKTKTNYNRRQHHYCSNECQLKKQHELTYEDRMCEICGKPFHVSKKSTQRFCSIECQGKWQSTRTGVDNPRFTRQKVACDYCGKEYYIQKYKLESFEHKFCSKECRQAWYSKVFSQDENWKEKSRERMLQSLESRIIDTNTKPQLIINETLIAEDIFYTNEKAFEYYAVDNYLDKYNLIIEVMGDFWHSNPLKYDINNLRDVQRKRIPKDKAKHTYFKNNYNIEILYLWEDDIYNNLDVCKSLIDKYINNNGILENYHSFNYHLENGILVLNDNIIIPYQSKDIVNA